MILHTRRLFFQFEACSSGGRHRIHFHKLQAKERENSIKPFGYQMRMQTVHISMFHLETSARALLLLFVAHI